MPATKYVKSPAVTGEASWGEIAAHARSLRSAYLAARVRDAFAAVVGSRRAR